MTSLNKILLADEQVSFHTKKSFVIFFMPVVWTLVTLLFFYQGRQFISGSSGLPLINSLSNLAFFPAIISLLSWANQGLMYVTSDFIVTNQRVIMREGFFTRHATETRLSAIAEVKIDQSFLGQILDFGSITINSFGGGAEVFASINHPYEFQRKVSEKTQGIAR